MAKKKQTKENAADNRLPVLKTYKMYVDGAFPRTESGRYYSPDSNGQSLGNICLASRKDVRNAVVAARTAQPLWAGRSAFNRGQILYRIAEMLEGRREQFISELISQGRAAREAVIEVQKSIDRLIIYAGWADKYQQIFSSVNPVASGHFNFSLIEPTGVVFAIANEVSPLLGLISIVTPIITGGNTCIVLASENQPLSAITFAEVLHCSDVPSGVINILTGRVEELTEHIARHMDINAIALDRDNQEIKSGMKKFASENVKRFSLIREDWLNDNSANPYLIEQFCEVKTTWHPVEKIAATGSSY